MREHLNAFTASFTLHLLAAATLLWFSAAAVRQASGTPPSTRTGAAPVFDYVELPPAPSGATKLRAGAELSIPNETGSAEIRMPNFEFDFSKIKRRAGALFPFLTDDVSLEPLRRITAQAERGGLINPYAVARDTSGKPPLAMKDPGLQTFVDRLWSRRERWNPFQPIADLAKRYSPSAGDLPALLRRYSHQNLLQPYVESHVRDPRLWTMLGIASDHRDFLDFITAYATANPSTKAATELLFMLDEMAQGSRDSLLALLDLDANVDLWWTRHENEDAHGMVIILQKYYRTQLERRGIGSREGTALYYDNVRLTILTAIAASTPGGYRASDARFLIGSIYWRNGRSDDALKWWRELKPQAADRYAESSKAILAAIARGDAQAVDAARVKQILDAERRRWTDFWWARLRRFGHTFGTF